MTPKHLPNLQTFDQPASWVNNAGHIDRSACVEVRVSLFRKMLGIRLDREKFAPRVSPKRSFAEACARSGAIMRDRRTHARILPDETPARTRDGRQTSAICILAPYHIESILCRQFPRRLAGDFRDGQANAMRHSRAWSADLSYYQNRRRHGDRSPGPLLGVTANPNRGAAREKILALPEGWYQPLRLERWHFKKRHTPAYYFVCPGCHPHDVPIDFNPDLIAAARTPHGFDPDPRLPALSNRPALEGQFGRRTSGARTPSPPGRGQTQKAAQPLIESGEGRINDLQSRRTSQFPTLQTSGGCPQRVLFLLLPLCTREEARDAAIAQLWIRSLTAHQRTLFASDIARLTTRYGLLFHPRTLVCRQCLQVRYGTNPARMAAWRKKYKARRDAEKAEEHARWVEEAKRRAMPPAKPKRRATPAVGKPHPAG